MTAIRRSEDPSFTVLSSETEAATAAAAKAVPKAPSKPSAQNQVESHKAPTAQKEADADLVNVSTDLIKGYVHPGLFESSRPDLAQAQLEKLPPREFRAVLGKLDQSGSLERFYGQLDPKQKTAFLDTAVRKGALQRHDAIPAKGALNPPTVPAAYAIPREAPMGLAKAANQSNLDGAKQLYFAQQEYLDRYEGAVRNCKNGSELRALGPYARLEFASNPIDASHPQYARLNREWLGTGSLPSDVRVQKTISNKLSDFMGEARAGSFFVEGKVEVEMGSIGVTSEASGRIGDDGKVSHTKGSLKAKAKSGISVGMDAKGKPNVGVKIEDVGISIKSDGVAGSVKNKGLKTEIAGEMNLDGLKKLKVEVHGSGVSYNEGRGQVDAAYAGLGGYGFSDARKAEFGGGFTGKMESGDDSIKFSAGLGMTGLSVANATHALNHFGIWEEPRELLQKKPWKSLDETTQDAYRRRGWSEQEWTTKVNARG